MNICSEFCLKSERVNISMLLTFVSKNQTCQSLAAAEKWSILNERNVKLSLMKRDFKKYYRFIFPILKIFFDGLVNTKVKLWNYNLFKLN